VKKQSLNLYSSHGESKEIENIIDPMEPQSESDLIKFLGFDAKMAEMLASAINKWIKDANTYEKARQQSAILQLKNADVPQSEIDAVVSNPAELRKFIQEQKRVLENQLNQIKHKVLKQHPMDLPTAKEVSLYAKHKSWFEGGDSSEDNPYPNDNAVVYSFLIIEIMVVLKKHAIDKTIELWKSYEAFCHIFSNASKNDSNNKAWLTLSSCPDFPAGNVNVGAAMREYVTDAKRCAKSIKSQNAPKLQSGLQRGPRRTDRIVAISIQCTSQFTILNLEGLKMVQNLVMLYKREEMARVAIAAAKTVQKGAEGLSDAESIAWLTCLGRVSMLPIATGRTDCSLPKLVGKLVNVDVSAFADLPPRTWSITTRGA